MKFINGIQWKHAVISGANNLANNKNVVDALNVFPVPDGDTGTNMNATIQAAKQALEQIDDSKCEDISYTSNLVAQSMLMGARGNSGVILSQVFRGFAKEFKNKSNVTTSELIQAFKEAAATAYKAVLKPIEGTILTVIRETSETISKNVLASSEIKEVFDNVYQAARKSCDKTPELLPVLKEVGVVDSGGEGLVKIFEGMSAYLHGQPVELKTEQEDINKFINDSEVFDGEFGYCTEFILELEKPNRFDKEYLVRKLEKIGSSMVVVQDDSYLKVHIHAQKPGNVLNAVHNLGQFIKIKIENMTQQANKSKENVENIKSHSKENDEQNQIIEAKCGLITCNTGDGIVKLIKEYGAHFVVEGGQTNNPSIQDIVNLINKINAKTIFILPNNSNVILSAQQASQVSGKKNVVIIPTKNQMEGLAAALNFNEESSPQDNEENMKDAVRSIKSAEVTFAVKDTKINGIKIKKGSFLAITGGKVISTHKTYNEAAIDLFDSMIDEDSEIVNIFYGQDASETDAMELKNYLQTNYDIEVEVFSGGQSLYPYYISVE
ncbi:DAK2 domain-containing protein [[Mycoplasma] gypis]|uniref:DAK2 domain-containing protein n=1 Tax=[Mycoplasma] gypis TaxID=92404 RepID=A0ABZ2RRR0_9BACT|nr:DAK2 domain-containing protein [[Mycoplasma] gypis]MBN0919536.1 DAK2 domain-containing protein [[Mycoplasma] gypis]